MDQCLPVYKLQQLQLSCSLPTKTEKQKVLRDELSASVDRKFSKSLPVNRAPARPPENLALLVGGVKTSVTHGLSGSALTTPA